MGANLQTSTVNCYYFVCLLEGIRQSAVYLSLVQAWLFYPSLMFYVISRWTCGSVTLNAGCLNGRETTLLTEEQHRHFTGAALPGSVTERC